MAPRAANVGFAALAGTPVAAAPREQHQPGADAPGSAPARAGAADQEEEEVVDDTVVETVEEMYGAAMREIDVSKIRD
ncbi:hypothetical protein N0V85_001252 [Neurospora sp. IMI 360204]|nr:hypothetical protein N0V85_001252 [Neurospora sp. IMI 360204]